MEPKASGEDKVGQEITKFKQKTKKRKARKKYIGQYNKFKKYMGRQGRKGKEAAGKGKEKR